MNHRIDDLDLEFLHSPPPHVRPTASVVGHLRRVLRDRGVDLVHGYEWPPILEAGLAAFRRPVVTCGTIMSMAVAPYLPRSMHLVVGTRQIAAAEQLAGRRADRIHVIEPPVDLVHNASLPASDIARFLAAHRIPPGLQVVVVSRLATQLKLEGLLTAIETVPDVDHNAVLTIVGDGPERGRVEAAAAAADRRFGRRAIVLTGEVDDPRPAYAAADVVLGMGGSALRGMAYGKPVVVQGEAGFWELLSPDTVDRFRWSGWYGVGEGRDTGAARLRRTLCPLLADSAQRARLGAFARETVEQFSLDRAATSQLRVYESALGAVPSGRPDLPAAARFVAIEGHRQIRSRLGRAPSEDFNARPAGFT